MAARDGASLTEGTKATINLKEKHCEMQLMEARIIKLRKEEARAQRRIDETCRKKNIATAVEHLRQTEFRLK